MYMLILLDPDSVTQIEHSHNATLHTHHLQGHIHRHQPELLKYHSRHETLKYFREGPQFGGLIKRKWYKTRFPGPVRWSRG